MAVQQIIDKILEDAEAEAGVFDAKAREKIREIEQQQEEECRRIEERTREDAEVQAKEARRRILSAAELEHRKGLLGEKQRLIEEAFQGALRKLVELEREEYAKMVERLMLEAVDEGDEEVLISSKDAERITADFLASVNEKLRKDGRKGMLALSPENREIVGGFILRRGKKEVNCSLESLFEARREELEPMVAEVLFSKEG